MAELNSVKISRNCGKIAFKFGSYMDENNINRNQLATNADIRFEVADRFYKGNIERLDIDVLTRVCFVLGCEISDVIEYVKP